MLIEVEVILVGVAEQVGKQVIRKWKSSYETDQTSQQSTVCSTPSKQQLVPSEESYFCLVVWPTRRISVSHVWLHTHTYDQHNWDTVDLFKIIEYEHEVGQEIW